MLANLTTWLGGAIVTAISTGGYAGVIALMALKSACIPLPSEVIMPFAGYFVSTGRFGLFLVATAGAVGCNIGSAVAFEVGAHGGRPLVERRAARLLLNPAEIEWADRWFERRGSITVLIGRLLPITMWMWRSRLSARRLPTGLVSSSGSGTRSRERAALRTPTFARIHDVDSDRRPDGTLLRFLTMQLIEGPTLAEVMRAGPVPRPEALALLGDVLEGLDAAHQAGIAHCDLKPNNVLLDRAEGQRVRAVITDFGLARALQSDGGSDSTRTLVVAGAPPYMAPELRLGSRQGVAGDIFAFGVMAYELLTGSHPFGRRACWEMAPDFRIAPPQ